MYHFLKNNEDTKDSFWFWSSKFTKTLLLLVIVFVLFNVNFKATAAPGPVTGEGHKGFISKWVTQINSTAPVIVGPGVGSPNTSYTYSFTATDPQGFQIRYGVDWNMDGTADDWLPAGVTYVNSGVSQSIAHSWSTAGVKTFQALTQNEWGINSSWASKPVTISNVPTVTISASPNPVANNTASNVDWSSTGATSCSINGVDTGGATSGSFSTGPLTSSTTYTLTCSGLGGSATGSVTVSIAAATFSVNVTPATGGTVNSSDGFIGCGNTCSNSYAPGTPVTLTATPNSSFWKFAGWGGDCVSFGIGQCVLNVNGTKTVTASFVVRIFDYKEF